VSFFTTDNWPRTTNLAAVLDFSRGCYTIGSPAGVGRGEKIRGAPGWASLRIVLSFFRRSRSVSQRDCFRLLIVSGLVTAFCEVTAVVADAPRSVQVAQAAPPAAKKKDEKVKAEAHLSVDKLPPGGECQVIVRLTIESGWHINTNPANPKEFVPTEISIVGKQGTKLADLKFPKGKPIRMQDFDEQVWVYDGKVDVRGKLTVPASAAGKTEEVDIVVKYQACDDKRCLLPTSVKLTGKLPVASTAGEVKAINEKLFPPTGP
jgi:DsbC/DsbD-like thiol-disulfide interchange protein